MLEHERGRGLIDKGLDRDANAELALNLLRDLDNREGGSAKVEEVVLHFDPGPSGGRFKDLENFPRHAFAVGRGRSGRFRGGNDGPRQSLPIHLAVGGDRE